MRCLVLVMLLATSVTACGAATDEDLSGARHAKQQEGVLQAQAFAAALAGSPEAVAVVRGIQARFRRIAQERALPPDAAPGRGPAAREMAGIAEPQAVLRKSAVDRFE